MKVKQAMVGKLNSLLLFAFILVLCSLLGHKSQDGICPTSTPELRFNVRLA
jgi:hypothetical protein